MSGMPYSFNVDFAREYGVREAIVINHFQRWMAKDKILGGSVRALDGRSWIFQTPEEMVCWMPFFSVIDLMHILGFLQQGNVGVLLERDFVDGSIGYAFKDEEKFLGGEL